MDKMSPNRLNEFSVVLQRDGRNTPWGIRLVGGSDLDTPLIITKVQIGSPAQGILLRGDMVTKIEDYDSRDLRHEDAQNLFRNAGNCIKLVIQRDNKTAGQGLSNGTASRSTIPSLSPINQALSPIPQINVPYRTTSPAVAKKQTPYQALPQTVFPSFNESGGYEAPERVPSRPESSLKCFSPQPTRDYQIDSEEEAIAILNQVIKKQFNSPIGLYSDSNIEKAIHQTVPSENGNSSILERPRPSKIEGYKKTVIYDPLKSETYRAIQEDNTRGYPDKVHEVSHQVQTKVFQPNRMVPSKKPASFPPPNPQTQYNVNVMGDGLDNIHQSGSFKRLMYSVLGETDY